MDALQIQIETLINPLGYEVVALEMNSGGGRTLRLYIDFLANKNLPPTQYKRISLDDCVTVNRAVDDLLENTDLITGTYNLEVSSPGVERPLRKIEDFSRFTGILARIHTYRPLQSEELDNKKYWEKNKKQKNFLGVLTGANPQPQRILLSIGEQKITIPFELISKAHLEYVETQSTTGDLQ